MLGRTTYHNVAGTRCATDLVELPSILMEHFLTSPEVLSLFARHYSSGAPLPVDAWKQITQSYKDLSALETNRQLVMACADQSFHSSSVGDRQWNTIDSWRSIQTSTGVTASAEGTAWHVNFTHLYSYGATYYSYLFDRAIAGRVWETLFANDPLSREAGERYKRELLRHGGGKDPWKCVGETLGDERIASGSTEAMNLVGSWNID